MARIKLPSYIREGNGRMEDAVIVTRGGGSYMMTYKKYSRGNTPGQKEIRRAFKTTVYDWRFLKGIIQDAWGFSTGNTNVSGYNNFIGANVRLRREGKPLVLSPGMGEEIPVNFTASPGNAGEIVCAFLPPETRCHLTVFARKETAPGEITSVTLHAAGADPVSPFTVTGLEPGVLYSLYAVVTDEAYENAKTVSPSAAAVSAAG